MAVLPERASRRALAGVLIGMGALHLLRPAPFDALIPGWLPGPARAWTVGSGVAEAASGALLLGRRTRRAGGWAAVATFAVVLVGNAQAVADGGMRGAPPPLDSAAVAWARLPLQVPLVTWALRHARGRSLRRPAA